MEIPLAATFLGLFGWNIYQLVKKYNARRRQSCLVKLIDDQSNSLIMTLYPYKKRKLSERQEVIIRSPQKVDIQEDQEQNKPNQYERIQTVLEQVEYERFQEQDYIDNAQTFDSIVSVKNKDDLHKNKQNQDFSFTSQNQNQTNDDQKSNILDVNNHVSDLISSDLIDKETSNFTFTNAKDQYQQNQTEDDLIQNNNCIQKCEQNSNEDEIMRAHQNSEFNQIDKNCGQSITQKGNNIIGQFQDNHDAYSNYYNQNQEEPLLPFFPSNNEVITSEQSSHFVQNPFQSKQEVPNFQIDILNQSQQQQHQNQFNCLNFANNFTSNSQPIYSVNNIQQSNQIQYPFYQVIQNNTMNMDLIHNQNTLYAQPSFAQQNLANQNTTFQNFGSKETTEIPKLFKEEFSFKKKYPKFDQINFEQNQFQNESSKASIKQIPEQKLNKGSSIFSTSLTSNQQNLQKDTKSNHYNDFSFYLQLLGGGGGLNNKVSVPSGNLLSLLLNN